MNFGCKTALKKFFKQYGLRPAKRLGQNFLIDKVAVRKIIEAADLTPADTVLEIGPGPGVLTQELTKRVKKVIAVEKDPKMVEILKETLKDFENIKIIHGDIRISDFPNIDNRKSDIQKYKVVGNLPFYLAAPVIRQFLENTGVQPLYLVLVVQKEVGKRICAKPPKMNLLAVSVQVYAEPKIISYISKESFWPAPKVDAAILKISNLKSQISKLNRDLFFKIVRAGFSQPRKQLLNNMANGLKLNKEVAKSWLLKNNIQPTQRAERLSVENWINLTKTFVLPR